MPVSFITAETKLNMTPVSYMKSGDVGEHSAGTRKSDNKKNKDEIGQPCLVNGSNILLYM